MITIHFDFTDGTELSYQEGLLKGDDFTTCCLEFFNQDVDVDDVIVLRKDGHMISRRNINQHTVKNVRLQHDIRKMLVAGSFDWHKHT